MKTRSVPHALAAGIALCLAFPGYLLGQSPAVLSIEKAVRGTHGLAKSGNAKLPFNMVKIPKGDVVLGMDKELVERLGEGNRTTLAVLSASIPKHKRSGIEEFYCDKVEVTNAQWKAFLDATGRTPSHLLRQFAWSAGPEGGMSYPEGQANLPVRNVELNEAREFARWCGKRLPTEEEWMRAAAGDQGFLYSWGNEWDPKFCTTRDRRTKTEVLAAVGSHPEAASPFGVLDMTGSVWEWTMSPFNAYEQFQALTLVVGSRKEIIQPGFDSLQYVIKGGYYVANPTTNLLPVRQPALPNTSDDTLGFRCVKSVEPGKDILDAARGLLASSYLKDIKWDDANRYAIEIEEADKEKQILVNCDHFMFAPVKGLLTSVNKITKNENSFPDGLLPLGILSVTRPIEEPNLPAGAYTLVYRHGTGAAAPTAPAAGAPAEEPAAGGDEGKEPTPEEEKPQEEDPGAKEAPASSAEAPQEGPPPSSGLAAGLPEDKHLVLFVNRSGVVAGYAAIQRFQESGEEDARIVHVAASGVTMLEFTVTVLGTRYPRFIVPVKVRNNPFQH